MLHIFLIVLSIFLLSISSSEAADLYRFIDGDECIYYTNIPGKGHVKVPLPIKRTLPRPSSPISSESEAYDPIIASASQRFTIDPDLVRAVIKAESNFNHRAVSLKGALGLMQLMPETAKELSVTNPFDPEENIHAGTRYLSELLHLLKQNLSLGLAAYNAGPARVLGRNEVPPIEETRNYIQRVRMYYEDFKKKSKI